MKLKNILMISALALASSRAMAQATDASLKGTYTFALASINNISIETNNTGNQVGFCNNGQMPFGYNCWNQMGQDVITGTLVLDGAGHLLTGSTYTMTADPNSNQCSSNNNAVSGCPYKVPAGVSWSSTATYAVGAEVDYVVSGVSHTYQSVRSGNLNKAPSGTNICTSYGQTCYWVQLYASASGNNKSGSGTLTGTYTVQSNGSAVMTLTPSGNSKAVSFALVVPVTSTIGESVTIVGMPSLGNEERNVGSAIRIK